MLVFPPDVTPPFFLSYISINISPDSFSRFAEQAMLREKDELLEGSRYLPPRSFSVRAGGSIDPAFISALRLLFVEQEELSGSCDGNWNRPMAHAAVSWRNERRVAEALVARFERKVLEEEEAVKALASADEQAAEGGGEGGGEGMQLLAEVRQLRRNRAAVVQSAVDSLNRFLEEHSSDETQRETQARHDQRPPNLLDFLPDYMPNIALMGKPAGE